MVTNMDITEKPVTKDTSISKLRWMVQNYQLYLFILPAFVLLIIFRYVPMYGVLIAFKDFNPLEGILRSPWVGFEHFKRFLSHPDFSGLLLNTVKLSGFELLFGFPVPIILAIMINQVKHTRVKKYIQLVVYAPNFISTVIIVGMLFIFLSPTGPINSLLESLGFNAKMFMSEPGYFRTIYIASGIWQGAGWSSIIYLATLSNVNTELIDAAKIDGANLLQRIWHIDFQTIKPIIATLFILAAGGIMGIGYEKAFLMQTAMNIPTSEILPTYVYKQGLQMGDYSYSAAVGLFNSVINVGILLGVNFVVKKLNDNQGLI